MTEKKFELSERSGDKTLDGHAPEGISTIAKGLCTRPMTKQDIKAFKFAEQWEEQAHLGKPNMEANVIVDDRGKLRGFASFDKKKQDLTGLWVHPSQRRKGLATDLIESFSKDVKQVTVESKNKRAAKFYEALGFKDTGKAPEEGDHRLFKRKLLRACKRFNVQRSAS